MAGMPPANVPHISAQPMMQPPQPAMPPFPMGMRAPLMPVPPMMMPGPMGIPPMAPTFSAPPMPNPMGLLPLRGETFISAKPYTKPVSVADMKANTTVFVGNITDKANDSLVRQILLRCGYIVGWKRVQNATGKLQAFGFCEYADPECTLRAMRLLNGFNLGDKNLVVKVDSKNKKELLKYLTKKTKLKTQEEVTDEEVEKEVEEILSKDEANPFETELDSETKDDDKKILSSINTLVKENINVLSGEKTNEDIRREHDVNESLLAMAIQSGRVDEDTTLEGVDMEDDMKTLVSDEIKKFRKSYQDYEEKQAEQRMKRKLEKKEDEPVRKSSPVPSRSRSPTRARSKSPKRRRSRSPRTRSQERRDRAKEREQRKKEEREKMLKEEEEYEQRQLERKKREREKVYLKALEQWESRERRKAKEYRYAEEEEEERHEKMEREKKCLAEFLEDYDDEKDDHRFYRGSVYNHRRSERDMEIDDDNRDRKREKEELETLRLEVMERQLRELEEEKRRKEEEEEAKGGWSEANTTTKTQSQRRNEDEEEEMVVVKSEVDESLPLTKPGYLAGGFMPIKVQAAPAVNAPPINPEIKSNPNEETTSDISLVPYGPPGVSRDNGEDTTDSPQQSKLTFELGKKSSKVSNIQGVFSHEEEKEEVKPKKKLYTLTSSSRGSHFTAVMAEMPHGGTVTAEDRKKLIQSLVSSIPSKREELFHWDLKWNQIDQNLMEKRIGPWINKKIVEYIGEPEPSLTEFICNKLAEHVSAEDILKDITVVLEEEAEVFVLKLWRLLIYETEARHLGIAKNY